MRTFPENLYRPDGQKAFGTWIGGLLGLLAKQIKDFTEFHKCAFFQNTHIRQIWSEDNCQLFAHTIE